MVPQHSLLGELKAWLERAGTASQHKAREKFHQLYGSSATPEELMSYMVATYGDGHIKDVWRRLHEGSAV